MAGLKENGLEIKRLGEVVTSLREEAVPIFQDLVQPGDVVDTSDSSTIGRLIGLVSPSISDLWEAVQEMYWAFDPNSARGVALDNLVMYGGLIRTPATPTTATVVLWGDEGTFIPAQVTSVRSVDNTFYDLLVSVAMGRDRCSGVLLRLPSVVNGTAYKIDITVGIVSISASATATSASTVTSILTSLNSQLAGYGTAIKTKLGSDTLTIEGVDVYDYLSFDVSGLVVAKIKARTEVVNQNTGFKEQEANTITTIATPQLGWDSVNNPFPASPGSDLETDEELRNRFRFSKYLRAQNISDSLYSALLDLDGVSYVGIYDNDTSTYDSVHDLQPHSFKAVVFGGNPNDIARAIWNNKPLGIGSEGNTEIQIVDSQGFLQNINFERPISVPIYITVNITKDTLFPPSGEDDIRAAIISYFLNNMGIGGDVVYSRLYTPINSVIGHQVDSLKVGKTASPIGTSNVAIDYNQIATIRASDIIINVS